MLLSYKRVDCMSMRNDSKTNEHLISLLIDVNNYCKPCQKVTRLYWGIINNSILSSITYYTGIVKISENDIDAINHHGSNVYTLQIKYKNHRKNLATALITLRKILPYKTARFLTTNSRAMQSDHLYHAINDFKYKCNSDFYMLFDFTK